jgi:hypothetical protein
MKQLLRKDDILLFASAVQREDEATRHAGLGKHVTSLFRVRIFLIWFAQQYSFRREDGRNKSDLILLRPPMRFLFVEEMLAPVVGAYAISHCDYIAWTLQCTDTRSAIHRLK